MFKVMTELKTPEAKEVAQNVRDSYLRMDDLKSHLAERLGADPFKLGSSTELGGDAVGANSQGVRVSLGGRGIVVKPWEQVSVKTILKMANYYIADAKVTDTKQQADRIVSIAVFCFYNGGYDLAAQYADKAVKLDSSLKPTVRKLMPDLLAN
jgi:hypothetical protein